MHQKSPLAALHEPSLASAQESICAQCVKPTWVCVCDKTVEQTLRQRLLILQHPQEQDRLLGTARLLTLNLPQAARLTVGLSWPNLTAACQEHIDATEISSRGWVVLYPYSLPRKLSAVEKQAPCVLMGRQGQVLLPQHIKGLVLLDGTWSQAKALWWRNPWLLRLGRCILQPQEPSLYGKLRREPSKHCVSTLEAVAMLLQHLDATSPVPQHLLRLFRTLLQRTRDGYRALEKKSSTRDKYSGEKPSTQSP